MAFVRHAYFNVFELHFESVSTFKEDEDMEGRNCISFILSCTCFYFQMRFLLVLFDDDGVTLRILILLIMDQIV